MINPPSAQQTQETLPIECVTDRKHYEHENGHLRCRNAENICNLYHVVEDNPKFNINHKKNEFPTHISTSYKSPSTETLYFVLSTVKCKLLVLQFMIFSRTICCIKCIKHYCNMCQSFKKI